MGVKGFQKGHIVSKETREKISKANNGNFFAKCDYFNHYVRDKHIEKQPCKKCGNKKAEAHHDDYDKPLEVRWLCVKCHRQWHKIYDNPDLLGE